MISDDEMLLSFSADKLRLCDDNCMLTNTRFLDIRQQSVLSGRFSRDKRCSLVFYGGYSDAERRVGIFVPDIFGIDSMENLSDYFYENKKDNPITAIRFIKDRFSSELSHRDYLGAIMALGIKRDVLGDIITCDEGCDVIVMASMADYITENLNSVARASVKVKNICLNELRAADEKYDEVFHSVASMRVDAVAAAVFKLSRTSAAECISQGLVYINGQNILKSDFKLSVGDKIVLRGRGKAVISDELGESKKGRLRLIIRIYK